MTVKIPVRVRLVAVVLAAVTVLTGCLRAEYDVVVHDDGTFDVAMTFSTTRELPEQVIEASGGDGDDVKAMSDDEFREAFFGDVICSPQELGMTGAASTRREPFRDGEWVGVRCRAAGVPISQFRSETRLESSVTQLDGVTVFRQPVAATAAGLLLLDAVNGGEATELIAQGRVTIRVSAPGKVVSHNGTGVDGSAVTWDLTLNDLPDELTATWEPAPAVDVVGGRGSGSTATVLLIVVATAAITVFVLQRRNRRTVRVRRVAG